MEKKYVEIAGLDIPFGDLVILMLKLVFALVLVCAIFGVGGALVYGMLSSMGKVG